MKKFGSKIKENNDNNNVVLKGVLNTLDKLDERIDKLSGIVKEEIRIEEEKTKAYYQRKIKSMKKFKEYISGFSLGSYSHMARFY